MKLFQKIILVIGLTCTFLLAFPGIIPDANTFFLAKILVQGIKEVKSLENTYEKIRQFTDLARQTKNNIQKMLQMEEDVQKVLNNAKNIKDFKFADVKYFLEKSSQTELEPETYLPQNSEARQILEKIKNLSKSEQSTLSRFESSSSKSAYGVRLYRLYHQPTEVPVFGNNHAKSISDQIGMENYLAEEHGASYQILNGFADRFQQQALEIESSVKKDGLFSMNSAERMELLLKAGSLMEKSVELKMKANEVLQMPEPTTLRAAMKAKEYLGIQTSMAQRAMDGRKNSEEMFKN